MSASCKLDYFFLCSYSLFAAGKSFSWTDGGSSSFVEVYQCAGRPAGTAVQGMAAVELKYAVVHPEGVWGVNLPPFEIKLLFL